MARSASSRRTSTATRRARKPSGRHTGARPNATRGRSRRQSTTRQALTRSRPALADPALVGFLEGFTACLTSGDGEGVAECFEYPALMVMSDARRYGPSQLLADPVPVAEFFAQAPKMYQERGVHGTFPDVEGVQALAPDLALVRVRFPHLDGDGNDMGDAETSLYVLRTGSEPRICAAITLGTDGDRE